MRGRLLAVILVAVLAAPSVHGAEPTAAPVWSSPERPTPLPATSREDVEGRDFIFATDGGRVMILHFWATWCVPCIGELPALARLAAELAFRDVVVAAVSEDLGGSSDVRPFLARRPVSGPTTVVLDPHRTLAKSLGVKVLPTTIVFGADGLERARLTGSGEWVGADKQKLLTVIEKR